jgi:dihydrofolate synthase/folylpolyglutamate synthase
VNGILKDYKIRTKLLGRFQGKNIALSILTIERLRMAGTYLSDENIIDGIAEATNPGRMELVNHNPTILLDGAHNVDAIRAVVESLEDFSYNNLILVLGILTDKDVEGMIKEIAPLARCAISTMPWNERACDSEKIGELLTKYNPGCKIYTTKNVRDALSTAKRFAEPEDLICVTGSLYTVGEARAVLRGE